MFTIPLDSLNSTKKDKDSSPFTALRPATRYVMEMDPKSSRNTISLACFFFRPAPDTVQTSHKKEVQAKFTNVKIRKREKEKWSSDSKQCVQWRDPSNGVIEDGNPY